ncbi:MAG: LysR family transcriptional regulator [Alcanivorax sp.]
MDYLSRIKIFVEVAKQESFTGAAKGLNITSSAVSKHVQNLENELQTKLFNRTTRSVSLTEEGNILFKRALFAIEGLDEAREEIESRKSTPKGQIKVSIPLSLGLHYLKEPIAKFAKMYPEIYLNVQFDDRKVNLFEEEYDIVLRIGALKDSSLIAKKLAPIPIRLFSSPAYLTQTTAIKKPDDLKAHNVFEYTKIETPHMWQYRAPDNTTGQVSLKSNLNCDSVEMMKAAALEGIGIFLSPEIFVKNELEKSDLVTVLEQYTTIPERNLYVLFPPNRYIPNRIRLFIDHIKTYCDAALI